ncbi:MAG: hypothetical protein AB1576_11035 [Bacillota bacterium]|jgi:hypothetical protein
MLHQYFFVSLHRAFVLSLAAENASWLAAMQAAEKKIRDRLGAYQQQRQTAITENSRASCPVSRHSSANRDLEACTTGFSW